MAEKRFTFEGVTATEIEIYDNGVIIGETCHSSVCNAFVISVVNLLNQLNDENERLKKEISFLQSELRNCTMEVRERTLKEVKEEIGKLERFE